MTATTADRPVTAKQQNVLNEVTKNGAGTAAEIADRMGVNVSQKSVQQLATSLVTKGLLTKDGMTYALPVEAEEPADFGDALAIAAARRAAGTALALSPSGKTAKMVTVSNVCYVSTDGRWATAKTGEGDTAWTLFELVDEGYTERGEYRTCNLAFAPENLS